MSQQSRQQLGSLLGLVVTFAAVEWLVGSLSHSLALQSDAGHMLTDAGAIVLALSAGWLTRLTFAHKFSKHPRLEVGAALVNGIGLLVMAGLISWEAIKHLMLPPQEVLSGPMLGTALIGLLINGIGVWILHSDNQGDLNLRGAFLHVLADLASSVGVIVGAIAISLLHCFWLDSAISLVVALLIGTSALPLVRQSWQRLLADPYPAPATGFLEIGRTDLAALISQTKQQP